MVGLLPPPPHTCKVPFALGTGWHVLPSETTRSQVIRRARQFSTLQARGQHPGGIPQLLTWVDPNQSHEFSKKVNSGSEEKAACASTAGRSRTTGRDRAGASAFPSPAWAQGGNAVLLAAPAAAAPGATRRLWLSCPPHSAADALVRDQRLNATPSQTPAGRALPLL